MRQRLLDQGLGVRVERTRRFVQYEGERLTGQGTSQADALTLTP